MKVRFRDKNLLQIALLIMLMSIGIFYHSVVLADEQVTTTATVKIPTTPDAIWKTIDGEMSQLNKVIAANKLAEVHHHAYAIRDLVNALIDHSPNLTADQLDNVKFNAKYVATLAGRLDASGDANDKAATIDSFNKLQKTLAAIRINYSKFNTTS